MEELRPKRSAVKKVLTYNINYHQIGYSEQRELQRALKYSLIEAAATTDSTNVDECCANQIEELNENSNEKLTINLCTDPVNQTDLNEKLNGLLVDKQSIDQIIDEVISQNLLIDKSENSSFNNTSLNTSINATINTVISTYASDDRQQSPRSEEEYQSQQQKSVHHKNIIRKRTKKSRLISSNGKKYLFNSPSKLNNNKKSPCKSTLNKRKILCNRKSITSTTTKLFHSPNSKFKAKRKEQQHCDENSKNDSLELNYKDKFKKRIKLDNDLYLRLNDVEKSKQTKKQCNSDNSLNDQVTNVFNDKREDFLNHLICIRKLDDAKEDLISDSIYNRLDEIDLKRTNFLDDQLLDDQLNDKLDLDNLINSLIDKLDDSSIDLKSSEIKHHSKLDSTNDSNLLVNSTSSIFSTNFLIPLSTTDTMVSNKNLSTLNSSNDKHLLNYKSSTKTNGHSDKESQLNTFTLPKLKPLKSKAPKKKKDNNNSIKKNKAKSFYNFDFDLGDSPLKKEPESSVSSMSSTSIVIDESINAEINSVINNLSTDDDSFLYDDFSTTSSSNHYSNNDSNNATKSTKKKAPKLFSLEACIKNEIKKKLLKRSMKLSDNKNDTNGNLTNGKKKSTAIKLNGKSDKSLAKKEKINSSPSNCKQNGDKKSSKKNKTSTMITSSTIKKPRAPHLIKNKLNKQSSMQMNGKRKFTKTKALRKRSERLIRNLYKFRQYLKVKKQELLNLDRNELSVLSLLSKDYLMNCFIDSNNFEIDFDIYDPVTINGLIQPFSDDNSILSNELLNDILNDWNESESKTSIDDIDEECSISTQDDDLTSQNSDSSDSELQIDDSDLSDSDSSDSDDSSASDSDDSSSSDEDDESLSEESWTSASSRI